MSGGSSIATAFDTFNRVRLQSPTLERIWQDGFGKDYANEARPDAFYPQSVLERFIHAVQEHLGPDKCNALLDLGCGHGLTGLYLARQLQSKTIFGIDISPASIALARKNYTEQVTNNSADMPSEAEFHVASADSTGLADSSCAVVVCLDVMLYFPDQPAALAEIFRILQPGGIFAFTTWEQKGHSERLGAMQVEDYRPLIREAGLSVKSYDAVEGAKKLQLRVMAGLIENEMTLRTEIGDEPASMLVQMAKSATEESSRRRYIMGIAQKGAHTH